MDTEAISSYQEFCYSDYGGSRFFRNFGKIEVVYTASYARREAIFIIIAVKTSIITILQLNLLAFAVYKQNLIKYI
jgi:hypothetical protein